MNNENKFEQFLYNKASLSRTPISGTFELLPVCNLNCKMCYIKKSMKEVNAAGGLKELDQWLFLAKEAKKAGLLFLLLTGGETFLYPKIKELYEELINMGFIIDINSNGTLIDENIVSWLEKSPPRHVKISLYGASRQTYENLCGSPEAFDKVIHAMEILKKSKIPVLVSITVTPSNYHELKEMKEICDRFEFPVNMTSYMFPPSRKDRLDLSEDYRLSAKDAAKATADIFMITHTQEEVLSRSKQLAEGEYKDLYNDFDEDINCSMRCRAGICSFWITWQGKMLSCAMMEKDDISVFENGFDNSWEAVKNSRDLISMPIECANCKAYDLCYSCAASAFCENGCTNKKSNYLCDMTKSYISYMENFYIKNTKEL